MQLPTLKTVATLLALTHSVAAEPGAAPTITSTVTVTSVPTACASFWHKSFGPGSYYSQHVCADTNQARCLVENKLSTVSNTYTSWYLGYGRWSSAWDGSFFHSGDDLNGGQLILSYSQQVDGSQAQCYFDSLSNKVFNCFNANGQQYLWWVNNTDSTVGVGLTIPSGTTQWQAYYMGY